MCVWQIDMSIDITANLPDHSSYFKYVGARLVYVPKHSSGQSPLDLCLSILTQERLEPFRRRSHGIMGNEEKHVKAAATTGNIQNWEAS